MGTASFQARWLAPLATLLALAWVLHDFATVQPEWSRRHGCWFPIETVYANRDATGWTFTSTPPRLLGEAVPIAIDRPRTVRRGVWAETSSGVMFYILSMSNPDITADPKLFLTSLRDWLAAEPDPVGRHAMALQTVHGLLAAGAPLGTYGDMRIIVSAPVGWGYIHNAATLTAAITGIVGAFVWSRQSAARRRAFALEAAHRCPNCTYDIRGLREPQCPECGAALGEL